MKPLAPNTLLQNRYLVVHLIGKGGMGDVYLAVDQRLGSAVALKRTFFADDELLGGAFEREARTLARLRHPVLPKVSDHFTEAGDQYLVMEHISGEDLSKRLEAAQKPFPFSWVLFWADQLLDALSYLHTHEPPIIHRDIKPQNLKLTDENHIILLDFGLSKNTVGETRTSSGSTGSTTGSVVGYTPHYAPMEQIRGTGTNPRSDLYSLSATIYQLLTNVVPADALSRADSMLNGLPDTIRPIYEINAEVSKTVSDVILKGMQVSQEKRFGSAREMQKTLRDAYAQMQTAMSAQTMAFNINDVQAATPAAPVPATDQKTEVLNISSSDLSPAALNTAPPASNTGNFTDHSSSDDSGSLANQKTIAEPNFDATLRMDTPPVMPQPDTQPGVSSESRQSDVKTEVFLANEVAAAIPPAPSFVAENKTAGSEERFNETENFSLTNDFSQADIRNETAGAVGFSTNPQAGQEIGENFEDFSATQNFSGTSAEFAGAGESRNFDSQPQPPVQPAKPVPPVKKGSGGKMLAVIAGLGALLLVVLGVAGGGWWYYKNHMAAVETPTPTPRPTFTISPTATPTPDETPDTNTNSAVNSSGNSDVSNSNVKNSPVDRPITPTPTPDSGVTPTRTPPPTKTPPPVKTPVTTPVPKATKPPIENDRLKIKP